LARRISKKLQREKKRQHRLAINIVASDDRLRSILGLMLRRIWLYSKAEAIPAYQLDSKIAFGKALCAEREGNTHYYR
jgi:hypothetical protein